MMKEDYFYDQTVYYRIWVSFLVFLWMRCRVYSAWMIAESVCVLNGIGLYPEDSAPVPGRGPTKLDAYKYDCIFHWCCPAVNMTVSSISYHGTNH